MFTTKPLLTSLMGGTGALALLLTHNPKADPALEDSREGAPPAGEAQPVIEPQATPAAPITSSDDPLPLPLGLSWGAPPEELIAWAGKHGLTHRSSEANNTLTLEITAPIGAALPGQEATGLEAHYSDQRLFEVSLSFTYPDRSPSFVEHRFGELKSTLGRRHGIFTLLGTHFESTHQSVSEHRLFQCEPAHHRTLGISITESLDPNTGESEAHIRVHYHHGGISEERPVHKRRTTEADETVA